MVGAAAVRQRVVVREDAPGPTAPRSHAVSRRRCQSTSSAAASWVVAHRQDGRVGDAVGVPVGEVAAERWLGLHGHRDGGEGGAVWPASSPAARTNVESVLEAPPHVVLLAAVDHKAEGEHEK